MIDHETPGSVDRRTALRLLASGAGLALVAACGVAPAASGPTAGPGQAAGGQATAGPGQPASGAATAGVTPAASGQATVAAVQPASTPAGSQSATVQAVVSSQPTPAAAGQPKLGGMLRFATADVPNLDGHQRSSASTDTVWTAFDRLIQYDAQGKVQPMLAESWDVKPDYSQIKFNLRKGVQFHTGRELTSDDVKWNILRVRDPAVGSGSYVTWSNWFTDIATPDQYTLVLTADTSRPSMFDFFEWLNILDPVTMQGPDAKTRAVGTGPFVFKDWTQGVSLTFAKNPNYWQTGKPYVDGFIANVVNEQSALTQLEAGALDLVRTESVDDIVRLKANPAYQAIQHPFPGTFYEFGINVTQPPYDNKLVRQALNYAIDRERYAATIMQGLVKPLTLFWSTTSPAYDAAKNAAVPFDLDKARGLLQQAGVTSLTADLLYIPSSYPVLTPFTQIYQADLAQIGVTLNILSMETATWIAQVNGIKYNGMYVSGDSLGNYQPATPLGASPAWSPAKNNSGYKTDQWSQLVQSVSTETDPAKQQQLYGQVNDFMIDQAWSIVFAERAVIWVARANITNVNPTGRSSFLWDEVWIG